MIIVKLKKRDTHLSKISNSNQLDGKPVLTGSILENKKFINSKSIKLNRRSSSPYVKKTKSTITLSLVSVIFYC